MLHHQRFILNVFCDGFCVCISMLAGPVPEHRSASGERCFPMMNFLILI
jgi:hypothetical protein